MEKDKPRSSLGGLRKEDFPGGIEDRMEDWYRTSTISEFEEGEVVRGRVVHVSPTEVLVDVGYKSEGAIPIEEFHRAGALPKVGDDLDVYLEAKEDSEGLIVLSKEKADKIKVWDVITRAYEKGAPVDGKVNVPAGSAAETPCPLIVPATVAGSVSEKPSDVPVTTLNTGATVSIANWTSSDTVASGSVAVTTAVYCPSGSRTPPEVPSHPTVCGPGPS